MSTGRNGGHHGQIEGKAPVQGAEGGDRGRDKGGRLRALHRAEDRRLPVDRHQGGEGQPLRHRGEAQAGRAPFRPLRQVPRVPCERVRMRRMPDGAHHLQALQDAQLHRQMPRLRAQDVPRDGGMALRLPSRLPEEGLVQLPKVPLRRRRRRRRLPRPPVRRPRGGGHHRRGARRHGRDRCPAGQAGAELRGHMGHPRRRASRVRAAPTPIRRRG